MRLDKHKIHPIESLASLQTNFSEVNLAAIEESKQIKKKHKTGFKNNALINQTKQKMNHEILQIDSLLSKYECKNLIQQIEQIKQKPLAVQTPQSHYAPKQNKQIRYGYSCDLTKTFLPQLQHWANQFVEPFYNCRISKWHKAVLRKFPTSGKYELHFDNGGIFQHPDGSLEAKRFINRDLSFVFYLNDDFFGGELCFPNQSISIKPKRGSLVVFPSGVEHSHFVEEVKSGTRFAISCWAATKEIKYEC